MEGPLPIDALLLGSSFVEDLLSVIDEHLSNPDLTVGDLADEMTVSRRQQASGESPSDLLRQHRMKRAKQMLDWEPDTVAEVAYAMGCSPFSRAFPEQAGCTPSAYVDRQATE